MAIDESDCWARELNDMDDIERQCPGTLAGLRSFFVKGDGNDTVLFGDPLNAQYAMAVVRVHFQCYKKLLQLNWDEAVKEAEEVLRHESFLRACGHTLLPLPPPLLLHLHFLFPPSLSQEYRMDQGLPPLEEDTTDPAVQVSPLTWLNSVPDQPECDHTGAIDQCLPCLPRPRSL